jgi:hypothetical protein
MPWLIGELHADGTVGKTGKDFWCRPDANSTGKFINMPFPSDFRAVDGRLSAITYGDRVYMVGRHTDNSMVDQHFRLLRQGMLAPDVVPTISAVAPIGSGVSWASGVIGYLSFWDEMTGERSPLSAPTTTLAASSNKAFSWGNLPTSDPFGRATHLEFWRSVDGGSIRLAVRRQLGVTSAQEEIATLGLGEVAPDSFTRLPRCKINALYHDRQAAAGDVKNPDILYLSAQFFPERYEGLSFRTRRGEPITGLVNVRDMLLVLCPDSSYILQGYNENDLTFELSEPELGCLTHFGIQVIHGNAWIPNHKGIFIFNGSWNPAFIGQENEWKRCLKDDRKAMEQGWGEHDIERETYTFKFNPTSFNTLPMAEDGDVPNPDAVTINTFGWSGNYKEVIPQLSGSFQQPKWSFLVRGRKDKCSALLGVPGATRFDLYTGSAGADNVYAENSSTNFDDQGDTYLGRVTFRSPHLLMDMPGGDADSGKEFTDFWSYVEAENNAWELRLLCGDEEAWRQSWTAPPALSANGRNPAIFYDAIAASAETLVTTVPDGSWDLVPKTVHIHQPTNSVGRGLTVIIHASSPNRMKIKGFGGIFLPGPAGVRGYSSFLVE